MKSEAYHLLTQNEKQILHSMTITLPLYLWLFYLRR